MTQVSIRMLAAFAALPAAMPAAAQTLAMVVPFSARGRHRHGGAGLRGAFAEALGRTVVIRNDDGASGTIGAAVVASAAADGNTIGYLPIGPVAIQPFLRETSYVTDDYAHICQTSSTPVFLLQAEGAETGSIEEWVEQGASDRVVYGSSGPGTIPHLAMAAFAAEAGMNAVHLPFDGTGPVMNAIAGGEIDLFVDTATVLESNNVTAPAIFAAERADACPDVPTMAELGYELEFSVGQGLFAPAGLEAAQIEATSAACEAAVGSDALAELAAQTNTGLLYRGPEEFEAFVRENAESLKDAGLTR